MEIKIIKELRDKTGCSMSQCKAALEIFSCNINQAYKYLYMCSCGSCRRKKDHRLWDKQDYINYIKENIQ